jgi:urease subunit beta
MIPGEIIAPEGEVQLSADRPTTKLIVANTGDRPIQVGSPFNFREVKDDLHFDRAKT